MFRPLILSICFVLALTAAQADAQVPDRVTAARIAALINAYRQANGLPPVPLSRSLTLVAETHALDMAAAGWDGSSAEHGRDARGLACNAHSWSDRGRWTPVCYTGDHHYRERMWSKPAEITRGAYPGPGFEIGYLTSGSVDAAAALRSWQSSAAHNGVILELGRWEPMNWQAMGVGVYRHYAFVWFGRERDPA